MGVAYDVNPRKLLFAGADTKSRTRDLLITNQLLYQLSYAGGGAIIEIAGEGEQTVKPATTTGFT